MREGRKRVGVHRKPVGVHRKPVEGHRKPVEGHRKPVQPLPLVEPIFVALAPGHFVYRLDLFKGDTCIVQSVQSLSLIGSLTVEHTESMMYSPRWK
jgi:hypothetical protein